MNENFKAFTGHRHMEMLFLVYLQNPPLFFLCEACSSLCLKKNLALDILVTSLTQIYIRDNWSEMSLSPSQSLSVFF